MKIATVLIVGALLFLAGELTDMRSLALVGLAVWTVGGVVTTCRSA